MTEAFPLYWPEHWPRTPADKRQPSKFKPGGLAREAQEIEWEVHRLGGIRCIVSTNVPLRRDGLPYSDRRRIDDPGVAVYFEFQGEQQCIPCDRWATVEENCRAIWKSIEALRGLDRWGAKEFVNAAFRGFTALPPPGAIVTRHWRDILGPVETLEQARARYRELARERHPDMGGSEEQMAELNAAMEQAKAALS